MSLGQGEAVTCALGGSAHGELAGSRKNGTWVVHLTRATTINCFCLVSGHSLKSTGVVERR